MQWSLKRGSSALKEHKYRGESLLSSGSKGCYREVAYSRHTGYSGRPGRSTAKPQARIYTLGLTTLQGSLPTFAGTKED